MVVDHNPFLAPLQLERSGVREYMYQEAGIFIPEKVVVVPELREPPKFPTGEEIIQEAMKYLGAPAIKHKYDNEGMSPEGFDCSGFVTRVLTDSGIVVPEGIRHVNEYCNEFGLLVHIPRPGDLIFISVKGIAPSHMGFVVDDEWYIHASARRTGCVAISKWETDPPTAKNERVIYDRNPVALKRPEEKDGRWYRPKQNGGV